MLQAWTPGIIRNWPSANSAANLYAVNEDEQYVIVSGFVAVWWQAPVVEYDVMGFAS